jgi:hypothetical protein
MPQFHDEPLYLASMHEHKQGMSATFGVVNLLSEQRNSEIRCLKPAEVATYEGAYYANENRHECCRVAADRERQIPFRDFRAFYRDARERDGR